MFLFYYLILINIVAFFMMAYDKTQAIHKQRRVPEKRLFTAAAIGGALGMLLGMRVWHHKTKHRSFTVGIPALLACHIILLLVWLGR